MKANAIVRIVLYSVAILVLLSILVVGLVGNTILVNTDWESLFQGSWELDEGNLSSVGTVSADEIKSIKIIWAAGSIKLQPGDVNEITFSETEGQPEHLQMIWSQKGDQLILQFAKPGNIWGNTFDAPKDLMITVPREWSCADLEIEGASAKVEIHSMTIHNLEMSTASGTGVFRDCNIHTLDIDTASGDILFTGKLQELDCDAASANCKLVLNNVPQKIDADMASGDLDLTLPIGSGFTLSLDALTGDFHSEFPTTTQNDHYICGDGSCRITVNAISGDVTIRKAEGHNF
jgi:hypothetical protein